MKALTGRDKIKYLLSLRRYELESAKPRPIGKRVSYYKAQIPWIDEELREEYNNSLLSTVYSYNDCIEFWESH
jgi:hypothetical protein